MSRSNFALDAAQKSDARAALAMLEGTGISLQEAARRAIDKMKAVRKVTVAECSEQFVKSRLAGCRELTVSWYENKLGRLTEEFGLREMDSVSRADIRAWLDGCQVSESTRASYARAARALWRWGIAAEPPMAAIDITTGLRVSPPRSDNIGFLSVDECAAILYGARDYAPALALMMFAGIRPHEVADAKKPRVCWRNVNVSERMIRIPPEVAKTDHPRVLEGLPDALWAWLGKPGEDTKPVSSVAAPALMERAAELAGYGKRTERTRKWPHDALRHTFATYAVASLSDPGKVSLWLGHEGKTTLLYRHYRGLTTKAEADRFWALRPQSSGQIQPNELPA